MNDDRDPRSSPPRDGDGGPSRGPGDGGGGGPSRDVRQSLPRGPGDGGGGPSRDVRQSLPRGPGGDRRGPPDTAFLNLEMSRVMYAEAEQLAKEAGRDLLREAITARLRERLGDHIAALARVAADELADDILANLDIEARIADRRRARAGLDARLEGALRSPVSPDAAPPTGADPTSDDPRKK